MLTLFSLSIAVYPVVFCYLVNLLLLLLDAEVTGNESSEMVSGSDSGDIVLDAFGNIGAAPMFTVPPEEWNFPVGSRTAVTHAV